MRRERGVAIVSVLLVVVVTSALAFHLLSRQEISVASTRVGLEFTQNRQYAIAAEHAARDMLGSLRMSSTYEPIEQTWLTEHQPFQIEDGVVQLRLIDLNARLNLNSLVGDDSGSKQGIFLRLCDKLQLDTRLLSRWKDWTDLDEETSPGGMEDYEWLVAPTPMRTPNTLGADISEARLLIPFEKHQNEEFVRYVDVLPMSRLEMNVNSTPAEIFGLLDSDLLSLDDGFRRFESVEDALEAVPSLNAWTEYLVVESNFFEVQILVERVDSRFYLTSRIYVQNRSNTTAGEVMQSSDDFVTTYSRDYSQRHFFNGS